ncbi:MAG: hypothetical protein ACRC7O_13960 [Fimbriiglobus sp.]
MQPEAPKTAAGPAPILIDLGKQSAKKVRRLKRGQGPLMDDVTAAVQELKGAGKVNANAQIVVVVVRPKVESMFGFEY